MWHVLTVRLFIQYKSSSSSSTYCLYGCIIQYKLRTVTRFFFSPPPPLNKPPDTPHYTHPPSPLHTPSLPITHTLFNAYAFRACRHYEGLRAPHPCPPLPSPHPHPCPLPCSLPPPRRPPAPVIEEVERGPIVEREGRRERVGKLGEISIILFRVYGLANNRTGIVQFSVGLI